MVSALSSVWWRRQTNLGHLGTVGARVAVSTKCYENPGAGTINSVGVWESFPRGGSI